MPSCLRSFWNVESCSSQSCACLILSPLLPILFTWPIPSYPPHGLFRLVPGTGETCFCHAPWEPVVIGALTQSRWSKAGGTDGSFVRATPPWQIDNLREDVAVAGDWRLLSVISLPAFLRYSERHAKLFARRASVSCGRINLCKGQQTLREHSLYWPKKLVIALTASVLWPPGGTWKITPDFRIWARRTSRNAAKSLNPPTLIGTSTVPWPEDTGEGNMKTMIECHVPIKNNKDQNDLSDMIYDSRKRFVQLNHLTNESFKSMPISRKREVSVCRTSLMPDPRALCPEVNGCIATDMKHF